MRNLTIKRTKSFVGCLAKMKVYIEDPMTGELVINNVRCRKLGLLKNGETKTFTIGDEAAKVYVIADQASRNYCNDFFQLPEGQEDISLTGKNTYNPVGGNPFRFDNNSGADVVANRKKGTRVGLIVLAVAVAVGLVVGSVIGFVYTLDKLAEKKTEPKTFTCKNMQITLTQEFYSFNEEGFDCTYGSENVTVIGLQESFAEYPELADYSLAQYGQKVMQAGNLTYSFLMYDEDQLYFTYDAENADSGITYHYKAYLYKSNDAFWMIQFATEKDEADAYNDRISAWAKTVTFTN